MGGTYRSGGDEMGEVYLVVLIAAFIALMVSMIARMSPRAREKSDLVMCSSGAVVGWTLFLWVGDAVPEYGSLMALAFVGGMLAAFGTAGAGQVAMELWRR